MVAQVEHSGKLFVMFTAPPGPTARTDALGADGGGIDARCTVVVHRVGHDRGQQHRPRRLRRDDYGRRRAVQRARSIGGGALPPRRASSPIPRAYVHSPLRQDRPPASRSTRGDRRR